MSRYVDFHAQLASIMEVLANAAVAEICQLVDEGFATLRLEVSRSQRENLALKSRLRLMEVRSGEQSSPQLVVTCTKTDQQFGEDGASINGRRAQCTAQESSDAQRSKPVSVTVQLLGPEVALVKKESMEEELTDCSVLEEDHQADPTTISIGPPCLSVATEGDCPLSVEAEVPRVGASGHYEKEDIPGLEAQQQVEQDLYSHTVDQSHRTALGSGPNRAGEMTDLTKDEDKHVVDPNDSLSAESSRGKVPGLETFGSELSLTNPGVTGGVCAAAADWGLEAASAAVKLEAEASWAESFSTQSPLASVARTECLNDSTLANSLHAERDVAELDPSSLDSTSFDDLFSSPEVARALTTPHNPLTDRGEGMEESLSSSSVPFLNSFGNSSMSDCLTASSVTHTSPHSRSRSFPSRVERAFSCQQCSCLFSTSRDLLVHQRSHAGEKVYHCPLCKKPFNHLHQLKTHQRVHTGEKPFSCAQCGRRFSQSSHIKRHMSVHTGEKRYSCSLCGKRFSQACSLKVHQAVHTGERPYSCTKCGKSFSVLGNLVRHQSVHISK